MKRPAPLLRTASLSLVTLLALHAFPSLHAAGYKNAEFTRLHNEVKVLKENTTPADAAVGQQIGAVTSVATGAASRAELQFPDKSLTRLGANSRFTLRGDQRTLDLDQGVMLLQVPKQLGGAKVRTAAVTAAVTGTTVMFEYLPNGYVKLIVIEGSVDLYFNEKPGVFKTILAGQMIIMQVDSRTIPDPVDIDLKRLLKTSKLISADELNLPNSKEVSQAVQQQQKEIDKGKLVETALVIPGRGTMVQLHADTRMNLFNNVNINPNIPQPGNNTPPPPTNTPNNPDSNPPPGNNGETPQNPSTPNQPFQGLAPLISGISVMGNDATIETNPHVTTYNSKTGQITRFEGRVYDATVPFTYFGFGVTQPVAHPSFQPYLNEKAPWATFKFEDLIINGSPTFLFPGATPNTSVILSSVGNIHLKESPDVSSGMGLQPAHTYEDDESLTIHDDYYLQDLVLYSQYGSIFLEHNFGIYGGFYDAPEIVQNVSLVAASPKSDITIQGSIDIYTGDILLSAGRDITIEKTGDYYEPGADLNAKNITARANNNITIKGGNITARHTSQFTARNIISVSSSTQLTALADEFISGKIHLASTHGGIEIGDANGNTYLNAYTATPEDDSIVQLDAHTHINLVNVYSSSDVFKAQTLDPNGSINIGGGHLTAGKIMKIYAGSNGQLNFVANTTLKGSDINLAAGRHVKVNPGVFVDVPVNAVKVYTSPGGHQYNIQGVTPIIQNTNGHFTQPVIQGNYDKRPAY